MGNFDSLLENNEKPFLRLSTVNFNSTPKSGHILPSPFRSSKGKKSFAQDINLKISRINFENKQIKSSYAINNPFLPPLASPVHHKAARMNEIIDQVMESSFYEDTNDN